MDGVRKYGNPPYQVAVVHGGPGAAGEMAPVARELASSRGVLEPLQTAKTLDGQVEELRGALEAHAAGAVALVGFSWGAWLGVILAARHPERVRKLVLVGCGPFLDEDAAGIHALRMGRLTAREKIEVERLMPSLNDPSESVRNRVFKRFGTIFSRADAFDPSGAEMDDLTCSADIFKGVWPAAESLRRSGQLLNMACSISCPVVAIHGDYDPHPAEGVERPLKDCLKDFRFVLLENCGHKPWGEKGAKNEFYQVLKAELENRP